MTHDEHSTNDYIGGRFTTCPSCGELIRSDSPECRFCGHGKTPAGAAQIDEPGTGGAVGIVGQTFQSASSQVTTPPGRLESLLHTSDGQVIPPEYGPDFNPAAFCWPAFLFADLWFAEKGLVGKAMTHFRARLATCVAGAIAMILLAGAAGGMVSGGRTHVAETVFGSLLALGWLVGIALTTALSYTDARDAYRRYTRLVNVKSATDVDEARRRGLRAYWNMLLVPFGFFLFAFFVMLLVVGNSKT